MEKLTDEWIEEHQDKYFYFKLEKLKICLLVAALVFGVSYVWLRRQNLILTSICLLIPSICVALDGFFPAYFTLAYTKTEMRNNDRVPRISLIAPFLWSLGFLAAATVLNMYFASYWRLLLSGLLLGTLITLIFIFTLPEFRSNTRAVILPLVILLVTGFGISGQINYWLDMSEPETIVGEVVEFRDHEDSLDPNKYDWPDELTGTQYSCAVQLPDGTRTVFTMRTVAEYRIGDQAVLDRMDGFLGLECYSLRTDKLYMWK